MQLGHRISVDIDLFSDSPYGTLSFDILDASLQKLFPYVDLPIAGPPALGRSYFIGESENDNVKLDLYYSDPFIEDIAEKERIRLASLAEIAAMKGGRKKDFWDLHELLTKYSVGQMIAFHKLRYPYSHDEEKIRKMFTDFTLVNGEFTPLCLKDKRWEFIKLDILDAL